MSQTYKTLLSEFLIIVIGVLTAFGIEELASSINDKTQKKQFLQSIHAELLENKKNLDRVIDSYDQLKSLTDTLLNHLNNQTTEDPTELFERFTSYSPLVFNIGSYDALKNSRIYDKLDNIKLTVELNNLTAQLESTLEWQSKIESLQLELFIVNNNDIKDPNSGRIINNNIYSVENRNNITSLGGYREVLNSEFKTILEKVDSVIELLDKEID